MIVPDKAIELAKKFEGLRLDPYICPAGFWTVGYGHLCAKNQKPITKQEADKFLEDDLLIAMSYTLKHCPVLATEDDAKLSAIIDFTFNLGPGRLRSSTLRRRINQKDWSEAKKELMKWVYGGGRVLPGLALRRTAEAALL